MKAVVFAAGVGTRLKPFTDYHPKALVEVGGKPVLERVMRKLVAAGADGIVVNIHHFPEQIRRFLADTDFGVPVEISDESALLLDTAGGLAKIARESAMMARLDPEEPVVVHNADILTDFPIAEMVEEHRRADADATVLVEPNRFSTRAFLFDDTGRLHGWHNSTTGQTKPAGLVTTGLVSAPFGGVHVLKRRTLDLIADAFGSEIAPLSITDWYLDDCRALHIHAYTPSAPYRWHDIGTPEKLAAARADRLLK